MEKELVNEIENTAGELLKVIAGFGQDVFNTVPFKDSWTPGQVVEHVSLSASGILKTVEGNTGPTERDPGQMVAPLRDAFLNFSVKMQSPDFIIPSDEPKDKASMMQSLKDTFAGLARVARTQDLLVTCLDFDMPMVGPMTRLEWISFAVVHTQRHIWQLKKIKAIVG
ncbi:MAG TPA: DinB family protein [Puia sp.]|nr:DinB family protein [Puia sp.]